MPSSVQITESLVRNNQPAKARVLVVGPHPNQVGGVATFVGILLSSAMLQEKYELIHLDTSRGEFGDEAAGKFAFQNVKLFLRQSFLFIKVSLQKKPQITHIPINMSWAFWKEAAFLLLARLFGSKVVAHLHEGVFDQYYRKSPHAMRRLIGWVLSRANVVIALSNRWKEFLLREVRQDLNVEVVSNTVDPAFAAVIDHDHQERSDKLVLYMGGLSSKKGVYDILKAIPQVTEQCKETRFLFAGSMQNKKVEEEINSLCDGMRIRDRVEFLGAVTGEEKIHLFQKSTIFVFPSYADNLPYVLLEAMSTGLPVVTTPVGAIPELVRDGDNGFLIEPGDCQALARRIIELLQGPEIRRKMELANKGLILNEYLPEYAAKQLDQIYSSLVQGRE